MKETEKIEIMHFDQEGYLEDGKALYETGKKMTALADKVADEGYDAVFLMGVGGTWDELIWNGAPFGLESNYELPPACRYEYQPSVF